ncbi:SDR family oxidoreductase [Sphingosinicella terrae]|uniref:SDR family oxidoreductase n=1 Tax=Sphingosinicella terrae TaxID=2172047 RepID=UPI000E0DED5E|nr:SDR family oxidoreductase [Sphingosinicella terrae]
MTRILVIGGYGGFGGRLCRRLSDAGYDLLVGGRDERKARSFCAALPRAVPVAIDREGEIASILQEHRPDLVIDAAGPFQASGYDVPLACIAARIPYLDLADATGFVAGIAALDEAARRSGVALVSGASSLPALSTAVAERLAEGLDAVRRVDIALSAANRAMGGASVLRAALSYAGRPVRLRRGGRWTYGFGWQDLRRIDFELPEGRALRGRLVALADVPDLVLLPDRLPGQPTVVFRAGTELRFHMLALSAAAAVVRCGWLRSLLPAARPIVWAYGITRALGGVRSAMRVALAGRIGNAAVERIWTLVAERGQGLELPTLAATLLAEKMLAGRIAPGARSAAGLVPLEAFEKAFEGIDVRWELTERTLPPPLYARLMGDDFVRLPTAVRNLHDLCADGGAEGDGMVERGRGLAAGLLGFLMGMPPPGKTPIHVAFTECGGAETWTRDFGGHLFASELSGRDGLLVERFGPVRFAFQVPGGPDGLEMKLHRWSFLGLPMPAWLGPRISAREYEEGGRFRFDVRVSMPLVGQIVRYSGSLDLIHGGDDVI